MASLFLPLRIPGAAIAGPDRGRVVGWGANDSGQAVAPGGLSNVIAVAAGYNYSLALKSDGNVTGWGTSTNVPADVTNVVAISAGWGGLALRRDGTVSGWLGNGWSAGNVPTDLTNVVAIASAADSDFQHNMALKGDGTLVDSQGNPGGLGEITAISAGPSFSLALRSDGTVAAWGNDDYGQTDVPLGLKNVIAISAGGFHSMVLKGDGTVAAWGYDGVGQADVPAGLSNVVAISAGDEFSLALKGDGTVVGWGWDDAHQATVPPGISHAVAISAGWYHSLALTQAVHYVKLGNPSPAAPYTAWSSAATNIQDAIDAAPPGDLVLVSNGVYQAGGQAVFPLLLTNRIAVTKPLTVKSVNGPGVTVIEGNPDSGDSAVRCAYLASGSRLSGFTLTNGSTHFSEDITHESAGGGVWCEDTNVLVSGCVLAGNSGYYLGGGAYSGTLERCILTGNTAQSGGGANSSTLNHCILSNNAAGFGGGGGGGADSCTLNHCSLISNYGGGYGGGARFSTLNNCVLVGNGVSTLGGGASESTLNNCTLTGNGSAESGAGVSGSILDSCIAYYNAGDNYFECTFVHSCTDPLPDGSGNITNAPGFVDLDAGNLRLASNSLCINSGLNSMGVDLDGNPRVAGGTVDIGAYEFQAPASLISYAWLHQYGLPTDGSADSGDPDGDQMSNWREWQAGTDPTNNSSVLRLLAPASGVSGITVQWLSVTNRRYSLERATGLAPQPSFQTVATDILGQQGATLFTDTNGVAGNGPFYYRVGTRP